MDHGISSAIARMTGEIVSVLDGDVYGVWLYGSVVMDDFRPGWSDIDFVALARGTLSESQAERLLTLRQEMLGREPGNPYYRSFEGVIAGSPGLSAAAPRPRRDALPGPSARPASWR